MNSILWKTDELDPTAIHCHGRFLMALRNFVKPILLVKQWLKITGDFEKKHRRMLHWNKDILAECIGKSFLCFSYFVFGGVFVWTLYCPASVAKYWSDRNFNGETYNPNFRVFKEPLQGILFAFVKQIKLWTRPKSLKDTDLALVKRKWL